jgi:hypothetical protein
LSGGESVCKVLLLKISAMKKVLSSLLLIFILFSSCGPKPMYKTREGKRKKKYYDIHQHDRYERDMVLIKGMEKPKKQKEKKKKYKF